jgi:hypothetical protein
MRAANMKLYLWKEQEYKDHGLLFPPEITEDPWVLYHGTSQENSDAIERDGLQWRPGVYSVADIIELVSVFHSLGWHGESGDGIGVLNSYTRTDFAGGAEKPVYLAETAWRASRYARRSSAGGETASALRAAFDHLLLYVADRSTRDQHAREKPTDIFAGSKPWTEVASVSVAAQRHGLPDEARRQWVEVQLGRLVNLHARCRLPLMRYELGVVYAIRFTPDDLASMRSRKTGGVEWLGRIPPERLTGKVMLRPNYEHQIDLFTDPDSEIDRRWKAGQFWHSEVLKRSDASPDR